ncbi:hypothetical protein AB1Y20_003275 [Prymnesium parvum]|uniref:BTB domain-containing protein n=1 Tax=Prymnesium parvum TaxID=97485 RepID=A0AB34JBJ3_PRYPA
MEAAGAETILQCRKRWFEVVPRGEPPCGRCSHTATRVGWNLYIIGGGAVWMLDLEGAEWEQFSDVCVLDLRTMEWSVASASPAFPARRGHSAVLHDASDQILIFGGTRGGNERSGLLNDVWALANVREAERLAWREVATTGARPSPRRGHRAVLRGELMVVVGGYGEGVLHALCVRRWAWSAVRVDGPAPTLLALFGCALVGEQLLCFGGHVAHDGAVRMSNQLLAVDLAPLFADAAAAVCWRILPTRQPPPAARICCEMVELSERALLVFGGTAVSDTALNDTHVLLLPSDEAASAEWSEVTLDWPAKAPPVRNAMSMCRVGSRLLVFGGGIYAETYYNDVWCLQLELRPHLPPPPPFVPTQLQPYLASLVGSEAHADLAIRLADGATVPAHRLLLCSGSSGYLSALLQGSFSEARETASLVLTLPGDGWSRETVLHVLRFLYAGELPAGFAEQPALVTRLLEAADALHIESLRAQCEAVLALAVDAEQVVEVLLLADSKGCAALRQYCLSFLQENFGPLRRYAVGLLPPPALCELSGFDQLSEELRHEVEWLVHGASRSEHEAAHMAAHDPPLPERWAHWCAIAREMGVRVDGGVQLQILQMEDMARRTERELADASVRALMRSILEGREAPGGAEGAASAEEAAAGPTAPQ